MSGSFRKLSLLPESVFHLPGFRVVRFRFLLICLNLWIRYTNRGIVCPLSGRNG